MGGRRLESPGTGTPLSEEQNEQGPQSQLALFFDAGDRVGNALRSE